MSKSAHQAFQKPMPAPLEALAQSVVLQREPSEQLEPSRPAQRTEYPSVYYWLWLAQVLGPGSSHAGRLVDWFVGDAAAIYEARHGEEFAALVGKTILKRVEGQMIDADACAARVEACKALGVKIVTYQDNVYPLAFLRIPDPPLVLYCTGNVAALYAVGTVGMVGTRRPTAYGVSAAATFGREFVRNGCVIISGLADGLDAECHRAAVKEDAVTIGVLGTPITKTYPASNVALRKRIEALHGAVISEYFDDAFVGKTGTSFLQRNRIIAAMSEALVVIEARIKSGTMSTVSHAERYKKPIYAVPGSIFSTLSEGTNFLLHEKRAHILIDAQDLLVRIGVSLPAKKAPAPELAPLSATAAQVLACVGARPTTTSTIATQCGLPIGKVLGTLTSLELEGRIIALPGRQYTLK